MTISLPFRGSIPSNVLAVVRAQLDAYCLHATGKKSAQGRFFWSRRGRIITLSEQYLDTAGRLLRRDSGRFEYTTGLWYLYCLDPSGRWRRYTLAQPTQSFAVVFRCWREDVTGIFQPPRIRRSIEADIEREALAVLVGG